MILALPSHIVPLPDFPYSSSVGVCNWRYKDVSAELNGSRCDDGEKGKHGEEEDRVGGTHDVIAYRRRQVDGYETRGVDSGCLLRDTGKPCIYTPSLS